GQIRRNQTRDQRLIEQDRSLALLAVASAEATADNGQSPTLRNRRGIGRYRQRDSRNFVHTPHRALGEHVGDAISDASQASQSCQDHADPAQQTFHRLSPVVFRSSLIVAWIDCNSTQEMRPRARMAQRRASATLTVTSAYMNLAYPGVSNPVANTRSSLTCSSNAPMSGCPT